MKPQAEISSYLSNLIEDPASPNAGQMLRIGRQTKGYSEQYVADELKLTVGDVRALEEEDRDRLPESVYVVGRMRAYARLLELDERQVVAAYQRTAPEPRPLNPNARAEAEQGEGARPPFRVPRYLPVVAGVVAMLLLIGWIFLAPEREEDKATVVDLSEFEPTAGSAANSANVVIEREEPEINPVTERIDISAASAPSPTPSSESPSLRTTPSAPSLLTPDELNAEPLEGGGAESEEAADGTLLIKVSADSWVQVRDAENQRLVFTTLEAGKERRVQGTPPYRVVLGNAPAVSLVYNGKPFDLEPHIRSNLTARFEIN